MKAAASQRQRSSATSRALHAVGEWSGRAWLATLLSVATIGIAVVALATGASTSWLTAFCALVQAVTLALVFVVQHTQDHDTNVTQRKLDAILAALPDDNEDLLHLETASDEHIDAVAEAHRRAGRRSRGQADETARR